MASPLGNLYRVRKSDIHGCGHVLADAFRGDPVWRALLEGASDEQWQSFFESPVRYGLCYGRVYATSARLEGIAVWVPGRFADLTTRRGIRSGSFITAMRLGLRLPATVRTVFQPLGADRHAITRRHLYLMIVGVAPEHQGQGFGRALIDTLIAHGERRKLPIYLETSTERTVAMYERFGFRVSRRVTHPVINVPQWEMIREPGQERTPRTTLDGSR